MLLIDIGNTRIKWSQVTGEQSAPTQFKTHRGAPAQCLLGLDADKPSQIWIASVAGDAQEQKLNQACFERWGMRPQFARSGSGFGALKNCYAEPKRLGVDRWLAMIACHAQTGGACVIADAGTALTVDVIDAAGNHQGGIIAAGLRASESAVLGATQFEVREQALAVHGGLGQDTESCVRQGAMLSCLGALERIARQSPDATCFIGGGDAEALVEVLGARWHHRPDMVIEGLRLLAQAS